MEAPPIKFYKEYQAYGYLSNFYKSPFKVGDIVYQTNEHYFQSKKFQGHPHQKSIIQAQKPKIAFTLGRTRDIERRKDWQQVKEGVMLQGLRYKFTQNQQLRLQLLSTNNSELIQHTKNDKYWADGGNGTGKNRLGVLLMKVRDQLRQQNKK